MKSFTLSVMLLALVSSNASGVFLRVEENLRESYSYFDTPAVIVTPVVTTIPEADINSKIRELRNTIGELRELLEQTDDPALQMVYWYQIEQLEDEMAILSSPLYTDLSLFQQNILKLNDIMQKLNDIMKQIQDTLMSIIRGLR